MVKTALAAVLLAGGTAVAAPGRPKVSSADAALCASLFRAADLLRLEFRAGSDFPDRVTRAFEGQGSGEATAADYVNRGRELVQLTATVDAQCRAAFGPGAGGTSPAEAAAIRRRAQEARRTADLYLELPRVMASIDEGQNPADEALRPEFLKAMYKIADGPDYAAAQAIADAAQARRRRIRR
jgi:hypothetical protein